MLISRLICKRLLVGPGAVLSLLAACADEESNAMRARVTVAGRLGLPWLTRLVRPVIIGGDV